MNSRRDTNWFGPIATAMGFASALFLTGCASVKDCSFTHKLWERDGFRRFSEPAEHPNVALFEWPAENDVLVCYDAWSERRSRIERRFYLLARNQPAVEAGRKPEFLPTVATDDLKTIPVIRADAVTNTPPAEVSAVLRADGRQFTLRRGEVARTFDLPVYRERSGAAAKLALTPLAGAGDSALVAGAAALVGFFMWVQSGAPTSCR